MEKKNTKFNAKPESAPLSLCVLCCVWITRKIFFFGNTPVMIPSLEPLELLLNACWRMLTAAGSTSNVCIESGEASALFFLNWGMIIVYFSKQTKMKKSF